MTAEAPVSPETRKRVIEARWVLASRSPVHFSRWFCRTLNQHAPAGTNPEQPFPWRRPHLQALTSLWLSNPLLFIEKSRQMLITWWASVVCVWSVLFRRGQLIFQQSKKLEDVVGDEYTGDGLLGRSKFILHAIPAYDWLVKPLGVEVGAESVLVKGMNSSIVPIAQGGDMIRSHTASGLVSDETAVQPEFSEAFTASMASIRRGWAVFITTPNLQDGGASMRVCRDLPEAGAT